MKANNKSIPTKEISPAKIPVVEERNGKVFLKPQSNLSDGPNITPHQIIAFYESLNDQRGEIIFSVLPSHEKETDINQIRIKYGLSSQYFWGDDLFYNNIADLNSGDSIEEFRSYQECPKEIRDVIPIEKWNLCSSCKNEYSRKFYSKLEDYPIPPFCIHKISDLAIYEIGMQRLPELIIKKPLKCINCGSYKTFQVDRPPIESYMCEKCHLNWTTNSEP